jgi:DNA polymerase III alpha subunit
MAAFAHLHLHTDDSLLDGACEIAASILPAHKALLEYAQARLILASLMRSR